MKPQHKPQKILFVLLLIGAIALVGSTLLQQSLCIIYRRIGIPCPSCGMTRAFTYLFSGNIRLAFQSHPLFLVVPMIPIIEGIARWQKKDATPIYVCFIFLFLAVWILRMILFFPHTEPMVWNTSSWFYKILQKR